MSGYVSMASCSDTGARPGNEDAWVCHLGPERRWFAVVADGAGGHAAGAEASRRVVETIHSQLLGFEGGFEPSALTQVVAEAHQALLLSSPVGPRAHVADVHRMHSTVIVLWGETDTRQLLWSHVGDSRLYRIREGYCEQLTRDDSAIQPLVDAGLLTAEQAQHHPRRSQLLAALGMGAPLKPNTVGTPQAARDGDAYLLCSDGWWESLTPEIIGDTLLRSATPNGWLQTMRSVVRAEQVPRQDNFTAVAVWLDDPAATVMLPVEDTVP